jgi:uncharacterized membrane protein
MGVGEPRHATREPHSVANNRELSMVITKNLGMLLLGIYLIASGLIPLLSISFANAGMVLAVLAVAAGVLILLGR